MNRIIILQKKIIRIISNVSFDAHTGVLSKEQEILKFSDIYFIPNKFMYLFKRGLLPNYFRDIFTLASQIHSYNTRNSSLFLIYLFVELIFKNSQFGWSMPPPHFLGENFKKRRLPLYRRKYCVHNTRQFPFRFQKICS